MFGIDSVTKDKKVQFNCTKNIFREYFVHFWLFERKGLGISLVINYGPPSIKSGKIYINCYRTTKLRFLWEFFWIPKRKERNELEYNGWLIQVSSWRRRKKSVSIFAAELKPILLVMYLLIISLKLFLFYAHCDRFWSLPIVFPPFPKNEQEKEWIKTFEEFF